MRAYPEGFDPQPTLVGPTLSLTPATPGDREPLAQASGDPRIWAGHPATDRYKTDVFHRYFDETLLQMGGCLVIRETDGGRVVGSSSFYTDTTAPTRLCIGFTFLVCDHWGGASNRELKGLMLGHLFGAKTEAWFHIAPDNIRSKKATMKLGAVHTHDAMIAFGRAETLTSFFCLTKEAWAQA